MAAPAAPVAGVYVAGFALVAGAAYLLTPAGQRASQSLGEAMYEGGATAVDNITSLFEGDAADEQAPAIPQTATDTATRRCDGPHRGRFQAQGYRPNQEPAPVETSIPWNKPCIAPLKSEGMIMVSTLLMNVQAINYNSAGIRGPAFARMSQHVRSGPFPAGHRKGWGITPQGQVRPNLAAGPNAPRVDLEVHAGYAFT